MWLSSLSLSLTAKMKASRFKFYAKNLSSDVRDIAIIEEQDKHKILDAYVRSARKSYCLKFIQFQKDLADW